MRVGSEAARWQCLDANHILQYLLWCHPLVPGPAFNVAYVAVQEWPWYFVHIVSACLLPLRDGRLGRSHRCRRRGGHRFGWGKGRRKGGQSNIRGNSAALLIIQISKAGPISWIGYLNKRETVWTTRSVGLWQHVSSERGG